NRSVGRCSTAAILSCGRMVLPAQHAGGRFVRGSRSQAAAVLSDSLAVEIYGPTSAGNGAAAEPAGCCLSPVLVCHNRSGSAPDLAGVGASVPQPLVDKSLLSQTDQPVGHPRLACGR